MAASNILPIEKVTKLRLDFMNVNWTEEDTRVLFVKAPYQPIKIKIARSKETNDPVYTVATFMSHTEAAAVRAFLQSQHIPCIWYLSPYAKMAGVSLPAACQEPKGFLSEAPLEDWAGEDWPENDWETSLCSICGNVEDFSGCETCNENAKWDTRNQRILAGHRRCPDCHDPYEGPHQCTCFR